MSTNPGPHLLIRCPAGHELQVATEHLHQAVQCPICQTIFTPGASVQPMPTMPGPVYLQYADHGLPGPVIRPAYTRWMLGLWMVTMAFSLATCLLALTDPQALNPPAARFAAPGRTPKHGAATLPAESDQPSADYSDDSESDSGALHPTSASSDDSEPLPTGKELLTGLTAMFFGCTQSVTMVIAVVLQLMWIYRIHRDAARARNYHEISPGLALGLCFVPMIPYVWTAYTLRRFARFDDRSRQSQGSPSTALPRLSLWLLVAGIVITILSTVQSITMMSVFFQGVAVGFNAARSGASAGAPGFPLPTADPSFLIVAVALNAVTLLSVFLYIRVVMQTEKAIYG